MSYPGIGTTNPAHQLETTSNVTAESLEIYSDYTFFGSAEYDWARQLRLRVNTPSSSNVFVDMGLEQSDGTYFYISKPLSAAVDPKNNFRIYQNGRILINRTDASRTERLQVEGDVKVTGNLNVTGTTTVRGDVDITGDLHVTSFNQEKNYIVPVGMIVMWDGAVADIPPGWALVTGVSGYYLRSNPTQTSVQTGDTSSFDITGMPDHTHTTGALTSSNHNHNVNNFGNANNLGNHNHTGLSATAMPLHTHDHGFSELGANSGNVNKYSFGNGSVEVVANDIGWATDNYIVIQNDSYNANPDTHSHNVSYANNNSSNSGDHTHSFDAGNLGTTNSEHVHNALDNSGVNAINVSLTPTYRQIRLIKKLPYT
jgi:hypothetical protein